MNPLDCFSADYVEARQRFRDAASKRNAQLLEYPLDSDSELTIDVAIIGDESAKAATVVSSGLHGVEGYFGSAAQLAWLDAESTVDVGRQRVVLIHVINPYGFSNDRRVNENNVDLNRNFLLDPSDYSGAPVGYSVLDPLLNPKSPPRRFEPFRAKALWTIARMGLPAAKQAIAGGQHEYPHGLFFGGDGPCESTQIVQQNLRSWLGAATNVIHVDLHTGLGRFGDYKLLLSQTTADPWYAQSFGSKFVEAVTQGDGTAYDSTGTLGGWAIQAHADINYRFVLAEFGTYDSIRVLAALRAENRAHGFCPKNDPRTEKAKAELVECFCPSATSWRSAVILKALTIVQQAIASTF